MRVIIRNLALGGPTIAILALCATTRNSSAYPADVFTAGAPLKGPALHQAVEVPSGSWSVSPQTGAAQFTFPIAVPPGRNGMAPQLALNYSSQNPLRGGIAAGWELPVPYIEVDTSTGILGGRFYRSSLAGGQRLIEVNEPVPGGPAAGVTYYRVESGDSDFVRYEHHGFNPTHVGFWVAFHTNGNKFVFGQDASARDEPVNPDLTVREGRWMLSMVRDPTGNEIRYDYEKVSGSALNGTVSSDVDISLISIEYGDNDEAALAPHARIELSWSGQFVCPGSFVPKGAEFTYRNGIRTYRGARRLEDIDVMSVSPATGNFATRRRISLAYDADAGDCTQPRAPLRILSSITQKVWDATGTEQQLPPIAFGYGTGSESPGRTLSASADALPAPLQNPTRLGDGARHLTPSAAPPGSDLSVPGSQPSVLSMLQDADGDGFLDALKLADQAEQSCNVDTYLNNTDGTFAAAFTRSWQRRPWEGNDSSPNPATRKEGCNLAYQVDRRSYPVDDPDSPCDSMAANYNASHLIDLDGDSIPELVYALDSKPGSYYRPNDPMMPPPPTCEATEAACISDEDPPARVACDVQPPTPWTFPAAENPGPGEPGGCGCTMGCPNQGCVNDEGGCNTIECASCDECGDSGLAGDVYSSRSEVSESGVSVWKSSVQTGLTGHEQASGIAQGYNPTCRYYADGECHGRYWWHVSRYDASTPAWTSPVDLVSPIPLESARGTATAGEGPTMSSFQALTDIDGDHCLDALYVAPTYLASRIHDQIQVFRGDCNGELDQTPGHFCGKPDANGECDPDGEPYLWPLPPDNVSIAYSRSQQLPVPVPPAVELTRVVETQRTLTDINGDGLPDYVVATATTPNGTSREGVKVFFNTGSGFETTPTILAGGTDDAIPYEDVVHTLSSERSVIISQEPVSKNIQYGWSQATLRPFDFDGDGRIDIAQLEPPVHDEDNFNPWNPVDDSVRVHINVGDRFVPVAPSVETDQWWTGLAHITLSTPDKWWVKTDVQDLNGDGLPDMVGVPEQPLPDACDGTDDGGHGFPICSTSAYVYRDVQRDSIGQGVRLLRTIENGRGATVEFEYGSSAERTGPDPLVTINEGRLPQPMWLVRTMTVTPAPGAEPAVSDFRYAKPTFNPDHHGQWAFRGFGGVNTWEPASANGGRRRVYRRYSYLLDYSGRPFRTTVWDGDRLQTLDETIWERGALLGGAVESFHPILTRRYTCSSGGGSGGMAAMSSGGAALAATGLSNDIPADVAEDPYTPGGLVLGASGSGFGTMAAGGGQTQSLVGGALTEEDCIADGLLERTARRFVSRSATQLSYSDYNPTQDIPTNGSVHLVPAGSIPILYVERGERLTDVPHVTDEPQAAPEDRGWVFGEAILYGDNRYQILPTDSRKVRAVSSSWSDAELWGRTQAVYDSGGLGLPEVTRVWQDETEVAETTRTFDAQTGNPLTVTEPSGLVTTTTYDSAFRIYPATVTPTLSGTSPPNLTITFTHDLHTGQVTRQEGPAQPGTSSLPVVETTYDGEGRVTQVRRSFDSGNSYVTDTAKTIAYFDHPGDPLPHRVHVEELINRTAQTWIQRDTTLDGLGRPIEESVALASGSATTTYGYDRAGNLTSLTVPSPTGTGTAVYSYQHDALGRVTLAEQPDTPGTWSFEYDGARVMRTQNAPDGSAASQSILDADAFGRLTTVTELRPGEPGPEAVWSYSYDPNDDMKGIVDADGFATSMSHDFAGHRLTVTRADSEETPRTWEYHYDLAGNLVAEIMPFDGTFAIADFTSTWAYDELGRVTSHRTASRGMSAAEASRYFPASSGPGALFTYHSYDQSGHGSGVGRLTHVELPFGSIDYDYTVEGWVSDEERTFTVAPGGVSLSDTRSYNVTYGALGQVIRVRHADANGLAGDAGAATVTRTFYDERGLPLYLNRQVTVGGSTTNTLLANVTRNPAGVPTERYSDFDQGQAWSYDPLGRVTAHAIRSCSAGPVTQTASRACATGGTTVGGETIAYHDSGDVDSIQDPFTGTTIEYTFDAQHQLVNAHTTAGPLYEASFSYTPAGRIDTAEVAGPGAGALARNVVHSYAPGNPGSDPPADPAAVRRLLDAGTGQTLGVLDYDPTGNLVSKSWDAPAGSAGDQDHDFIHDGDNQLREAIRHSQSGDASEVYFYDHTGQRMLAYSSPDGAVPARLRLWFGQTEIEYDASSSPLQPTKTEVFASLGAMPVARILRGPTTSPTNAQLDLLYSGVLGSLLTVVGTTSDPAGHNLEARFMFGPFGELLASAGSEQADFHRLFNGKEHDELTSLSYYGYRFYDRLSLTWTQADPLYRFVPDLAWDEPRRANLYSFSLNNPLRYIDPDGRGPDENADAKVERQIKKSCDDDPDCRRQREKRERTSLGEAVEQGLSEIMDDLGDLMGDNPANAPELNEDGSQAATYANRSLKDEVKNYASFALAGGAAKAVAVGVGKLVKEGASKLRSVFGRAGNSFEAVGGGPGAAALRATKAVNLPSWRRVGVDMQHILDRHVPGAPLAAGRDVFPATMSPRGIESAVRQAYRNGAKVSSQGVDRVLVRGQAEGLTIEMWVNKSTRMIETAYPVF